MYLLSKTDYKLSNNFEEFKIYGFGSDGMVSASKNMLTLLHESLGKYVEGYFEYDSKKSGGVTISHLRMGDNSINATFYVTSPALVVVTKDVYFERYDMLSGIKDNGILLINTIKNEKELNDYLSSSIKKEEQEKINAEIAKRQQKKRGFRQSVSAEVYGFHNKKEDYSDGWTVYGTFSTAGAGNFRYY